jgi:hypothetical protein
MKSRFDGTRCESCRELLTFHQPPGLTVSTGEQVDVMHATPWCERWRNPLTRESCVPRAILDECQRPERPS